MQGQAAAARIVWVLALLGAAWAGFNFYATYIARAGGEISAPQLAALAAECLVYAIVPYVFARAFDEATRPRPVERAKLVAETKTEPGRA